MTAAVAIVTDSTAYLPDDSSPARVTVVPLQVAVGGEVSEEGRGASTSSQARATGGPSRPRGPRPKASAGRTRKPPGRARPPSRPCTCRGRCRALRERPAGGGEGSVPVGWSTAAPSAWGSASASWPPSRPPRPGRAWSEVADAARRRVRATRSLFYVDTLEHLRRGGRIGAAATLLGSALMIKPLLRITGGRIAPLEKVRTTSRALARLEELAVDLAGDREVDVAVQHVAAARRGPPHSPPGCANASRACSSCTSGRPDRSSARTSAQGCWGSWFRGGSSEAIRRQACNRPVAQGGRGFSVGRHEALRRPRVRPAERDVPPAGVLRRPTGRALTAPSRPGRRGRSARSTLGIPSVLALLLVVRALRAEPARSSRCSRPDQPTSRPPGPLPSRPSDPPSPRPPRPVVVPAVWLAVVPAGRRR